LKNRKQIRTDLGEKEELKSRSYKDKFFKDLQIIARQFCAVHVYERTKAYFYFSRCQKKAGINWC
jgi:hypothetical protein